jgi:hypothetical protein
MAGTMVTESERMGVPIVTTREPVGPKTAGDKGTPGDMAVMDAVMIVGAAWLILFFLAFSLRRHNI